ncbi:MAG: hypothetical protein U5L06_08505 [Rhodovibrio sp.]|nr:hypothetical protein [Rhodovibrio sp.]
MPLWRFIPVAGPRDSRWQDRQIRDGLVVRAPTAAMARIYADRDVPSSMHAAVGNETRSFRGGFADANLYWVQRVPADEAKQLGGEHAAAWSRRHRARDRAVGHYDRPASAGDILSVVLRARPAWRGGPSGPLTIDYVPRSSMGRPAAAERTPTAAFHTRHSPASDGLSL